MLSPTTLHEIVEAVGVTAAQNSGAFVTEQDLQAHLSNQLLEAVQNEAPEKLPLQPSFSGKGRTFDIYPTAMEQGFKETNSGFPPVHMEVSLEKGERIDIALFDKSLSSIEWAGDSKKFDVNDVTALFEVKFVYWTKMPTESGFHPNKHSRGDLQDSQVLEHLQFDQVGFKKDVERLGQRDEVPYRCALMVSNRNHYYYRPADKEVEWNDFYDQMGRVAREQLADIATDTDTNVLYVAPYNSQEDAGGAVWLYDAYNDNRNARLMP